MWRRRFADVSMLGTESLALFVLASALTAAAGGRGPSLVTVFVAMLGGFYLVRFLLHFDAGRPALIGAGMAVSALALLALFNLQYDPAHVPFSFAWLGDLAADPDAFLARRWPAAWGVIIIAFAWFRAVAVAQRDLTHQAALSSYTAGLLIVVVMLLLGQGSAAAARINAAALPYFMLGLLTLSLIHLSRAEHHQGDFLRGPWLATLAGTVGLLTLVSALIGLFPIDLLNALLAPVGVLVLRVLDVVILIIALPIAFIVVWLINLITGGKPLEWPRMNRIASEQAEQVQRQAEQGGPPEFFAVLGKALFLMSLMALVGIGLWWAFRRLRRPLGSDDETRESLAAEGSLGEDLGALLGGLLGRFRRRPAPDREPALPGGVLAVRRLYVRALRRAEAAGVERPPAETPSEFAPALSQALHTPTAVTLSERFAAARYGLLAPSREELAELERETGRGG